MKKLLTLSLLALVACEYPTIEVGQYDVELGRRFVWEQGKFNPNGKYIELRKDTVEIKPTCLIGCYGLDSTQSYNSLDLHNKQDTVFIDTVYTFTYAVPK